MMNQKTPSKKPDALSKLRQIIREEVKKAIRDEMVPLLVGVIKHGNSTVAENKVPSYAQNLQRPINGSMNSILEETRREMASAAGFPAQDEYRTLISANTANMNMFEEAVQAPQSTTSIDSMIATAAKSSKEEMVEITQVPDFSSIMKKMNL